MSSGTRARRRRGPDALEAHVLGAARELHARCGAGFTMRDLEERSGVSRATIYRRVGSKRALLARLDAGATAGTRERVLHAVRAVVARHGMAGVTMERLAAEAGVGVATVYRHFGDRGALLDAFAQATRDHTEVRARLRAAGADLRADLEAVARAALAFLSDNRDLLVVALGGSADDRALLQALRGPSDSTLDHLEQRLARAQADGRLRAGPDARRLALGFVGMLFAEAVLGPAHYGFAPADPATAARRCVALFLDGAGA